MTVTFNRSTDPKQINQVDAGYYKFIPDQPVRIISFIGAQPKGKVVACYTSDENNHPANPHSRYVVVCGSGPKTSIADVAECELEAL